MTEPHPTTGATSTTGATYTQQEIHESAPFRQAKEGDQVMYVLDQGLSAGQSRPAFVVKTWTHGAHVNIMVLTDCTNDFTSGTPGSNGTLWATSVGHSSDFSKLRSWHWPDEPNSHQTLHSQATHETHEKATHAHVQPKD